MIGDKTERVRVVRRARAQDANGDYSMNETVLAERWASVQAQRGQEAQLAGQLREQTSYRIDLDLYGVAVTSDDKVIWQTRGNTELNIREVHLAPVRQIDTKLICESGTIDGVVPQ